MELQIDNNDLDYLKTLIDKELKAGQNELVARRLIQLRDKLVPYSAFTHTKTTQELLRELKLD